jgi:hypothetical protein
VELEEVEPVEMDQEQVQLEQLILEVVVEEVVGLVQLQELVAQAVKELLLYDTNFSN